MKRTVVGFAVALGLSSIAMPAVAAGPFQFHALTPCRLWDTRNGTGLPSVTTPRSGGSVTAVTVQGRCGVPVGADAVAINVTAVSPSGAGHLTLYPSNAALPNVSTLNFNALEPALANGALVPLGPATPDLNVRPVVQGAGSVHVIIDVTGYFD